MLPLMLPAAMMAGGAIAKTLGGVFGAKEKKNSAQEGAKAYMDYNQEERNKFLNDPTNSAIKKRLGDMAVGNVGYSDPSLQAMRGGLQEDYGKALKDVGDQTRSASVMPGGGYAPGRASRTARLLGENLAVRKAEGNRAITTANEAQAQNNMRYAIGALPTYTPGFSQTPQMDPGTFQNLHAPDMSTSTGLGSIGDAMMNMMPMMGMMGGGMGMQQGPDLSQMFTQGRRY